MSHYWKATGEVVHRKNNLNNVQLRNAEHQGVVHAKAQNGNGNNGNKNGRKIQNSKGLYELNYNPFGDKNQDTCTEYSVMSKKNMTSYKREEKLRNHTNDPTANPSKAKPKDFNYHFGYDLDFHKDPLARTTYNYWKHQYCMLVPEKK